MNLRSAIRKLELKRAIDAICSLCRGRDVTTVVLNDDTPIGCRVCGRVSTVKRIILVDDGYDDRETPTSNSEPKLANGP